MRLWYKYSVESVAEPLPFLFVCILTFLICAWLITKKKDKGIKVLNLLTLICQWTINSVFIALLKIDLAY